MVRIADAFDEGIGAGRHIEADANETAGQQKKSRIATRPAAVASALAALAGFKSRCRRRAACNA
jgi:hypothetical protein